MPVIVMVIILIDLFINVRIHKRAVIHPAQFRRVVNAVNHHKNLQVQMFIIVFTRICIFLITTLPLAIYRITSARQTNLSNSVFEITSIWTGLGWFQSLNYAVSILLMHNFYFFILYVGELLQSLSYFNIISKRI
jgi:hypothetical protein